MAYDVRLYLNSGFNSINIPDNPATLAAAATVVTVPSINILQDRFLSQIDIHANWSTVESCDYVKVGSFYYSVNGVRMLSMETARLFLTPDFITSAGGFRKSNGAITTDFDILDGITDRQTVETDEFGEYTEPDPLTAPQEPLAIFTQWLGADTSEGGYILLSTLLDLKKQSEYSEGVTYKDVQGETVTVPKTYQISADDATMVGFEGETPKHSDGTKYYLRAQSGTKETDAQKKTSDGIAKARALGIENAIVDQWTVPTAYAAITLKVTGETDEPSDITGRTGTFEIALPPKYATVKNLRVLYGEYNKYGIITSSGSSLEALPEEITTGENPTITWKADPRPNGKPYFRFTEMNGNTEFWRNCIGGESWQKVPLAYQGSSGSALTRLNFENSRKTAALEQSHAQQNFDYNTLQNQMGFISDSIGAVSQGLGSIGGATPIQGALGGLAQSALGVAQAGINYEMKQGRTDLSRQQSIETYRQAKANELSQLYQNTTIYTPSVNFPYNASIVRDVKGNGVLAYRYEYQPNDVLRIDKLLTMYGYKESEPIDTTNFFRRQKFDYVQAASISITGLPRWWNEGIADQLRNGVRIWHTKPDPAAYNNNPIGG